MSASDPNDSKPNDDGVNVNGVHNATVMQTNVIPVVTSTPTPTAPTVAVDIATVALKLPAPPTGTHATTNTPVVTSMVTVSNLAPTQAPTTSSTILDELEGPTCARYDDMGPDCVKIFRCDDLECGLCLTGGCVEYSAVVESFDCVEKDDQTERSTLTYIIMLPFLPVALAWLLFKWIFCNLGPCICIPFIVQTVIVVFMNFWRGVFQKFSLIATWFCTYVIYLPFAMGFHQVILPTITFICENIVSPICTALCTCTQFVVDRIITPVCVAISNGIGYVVDGITWGCGHFGGGCTFVYERMLLPCCTAIGNFFTVIWNGMAACITACCNFMYQYIIIPINNCVTAICNALCACLEYIGNFMYNYIWLSIVACGNAFVQYVLVPLCEAVSAVCQAFGNCLYAIYKHVLCPIGNAFHACIQALWSGILLFFTAIWDYVFVPIGSVISACVQGVGTVMNAIYENVLIPIGNGVGAVLSAIGNGLLVVLNAIGSVLAVIGSAMVQVLNAIASFLSFILSPFS